MEEKKEMVEKPETGAQENPRKKMSYEELENVAHQMSEQSRVLYMKLQEANMTNTFKRLDYLFKVVENSHAFNNGFVDKCISEIETIMTIPEETEQENPDSEETEE